MENFNNNFNFDFSDAVVIKERINNVKIGDVRSATYGEKASVTARDDGENFFLDFVLPLPEGTWRIDSEMSSTSGNPVSNRVIKKYIDGGRSILTTIFADRNGKATYTSQDLLLGYDFLICYATPSGQNSPLCYTVPIRYLNDVGSPMELQVADNEVFTLFKFTKDGFSTVSTNGSEAGKILALYGVTI